MGTFILAFWKEISIALLLLFIFGANEIYVDRIKLERDLAQAKNETISQVLEDQTKEILEASKRTERIVSEEMKGLDDRLDKLTEEQKKQIEDLLEVEIPEECGEEFNQFLIDMVDQLRWAND